VFGIADDLRKVKAKNQAIAARNEMVKINNEIAKNNALLRKQAMQELADEQERKRLAMMSPAQKEAYARAKAQAKKAEHDRQVAAENTKQYIIAGVIIAFLAVAGSIVVGLLMRMH
jgi:L-lactate utilization protein LutC